MRHVSVVGGRTGASTLLPGVLLDTPVPEGAPLPPRSATPLCVALYNESLEAMLPVGLEARVQLVSRDADGHQVESIAEDLLGGYVRSLQAMGVRVLGCQQRIAPALLRLLIANGILPLPRLSLRHIAAVRRLCGATPLSHLRPPSAADLGYIGGVEVRTFGGRVYTHLLPPPSALPPPPPSPPRPSLPPPPPPCRPVITAILSAPNRTASEELQAAAACALGTLGAALRQRAPRLVPGAGCVEVLLAIWLRHEAAWAVAAADDDDDNDDADARAMRRLQRAVSELLAEVLEDTVGALAGGGVAGREAVDTLRAANRQGARHGADQAHVARRRAGHTRSSDEGGGRADGRDAGRCCERVVRSFYGWDADAGHAVEVLRVSCDGEKEDEEGSDEEDEEDEDEEEEKGRRNRKASLRVDHVGVAELASEKLEAIFSAIEIACAIIGVDEVRVDNR